MNKDLLLHDGVVDVCWNDGDGDDVSALLDDHPDNLVLHPHHVLAVHLQQMVVDQQTIPGQREFYNIGSFLTIDIIL